MGELLKDEVEGWSTSQASNGPQRRAIGSQSGWLYQGSCVRSGRIAIARVTAQAKDQRPQWVSRDLQAQIKARGASGNQGQPPSSISITGTRQPISLPSPAAKRTRPAPSPHHSQSAWLPLTWACQRCHPIPGVRPSSIPPQAAVRLFQSRHSWPQARAKPAAAAAGNRSGAFSRSMALAMRPETAPQRALHLLRLSLSRASQSTAMTVSCAPSSIARRPCRATGNSVSRITLVASALERSPGRSVH